MYWYIWLSLELKFAFFTTTSSKSRHKSDNFYDIKKLVRILLDNVIKKVYKISSRLDENCFTYAASRFEKHGFEKKTVTATNLKKKKPKKFLYTLSYVQ